MEDGSQQHESETWDAKQYEAALAHLESLQDQVIVCTSIHKEPSPIKSVNRSRLFGRQSHL